MPKFSGNKIGFLVYAPPIPRPQPNFSPVVSNFNKWHHYLPSCSSQKHSIGFRFLPIPDLYMYSAASPIILLLNNTNSFTSLHPLWCHPASNLRPAIVSASTLPLQFTVPIFKTLLFKSQITLFASFPTTVSAYRFLLIIIITTVISLHFNKQTHVFIY